MVLVSAANKRKIYEYLLQEGVLAVKKVLIHYNKKGYYQK
jgi:hypothetical protein